MFKKTVGFSGNIASFILAVAVGLVLVLPDTGQLRAQSSSYVLFTVSGADSHQHWLDAQNLLQENEAIQLVRCNSNNKHIYAELHPLADFSESDAIAALEGTGLTIGCFRKGQLDGQPLTYFNLKTCEIIGLNESK